MRLRGAPRVAPTMLAVLLAWALSGCAGPGAAPAGPVGAAVPPRDAYVVLSGGGTPLTNNYSQYLQARALAEWLGRTHPADSTWFFFGVGNREGEPAVLADTFREVAREDLILPQWLPGALPRNRPATKESLLRELREEILPRVRGGGTLFLFVGDHGELAGRDDQRESAITLWQLKRGGRRDGWTTDRREVLGVAELRRALAEGLGAGRVVFCMTQCHSGGFHELAVPREVMPPRDWFTRPPDWWTAAGNGLRLRAAGYTATDQASPAAGCEPNPDPEGWAGYERFLPEALIGRDLMTGRPKGRPAAVLADAHEAAVLVDQTIDKPRATSEHFLDGWARLIESRLAGTLAVTERTQRAVLAYQRSVDSGRVEVAAPGLQDQQQHYGRLVARLAAELPASRELLTGGTRRDLEQAIRPPRGEGRGPGRSPRRGPAGEVRKAWTETLRPAWKQAVTAGRVGGLTGAALQFERHLLRLEDDGRSFLLGRRDGEALLNEVYWKSGYAEPARTDPVDALDVARWAAERRARIVAWGGQSGDAAVRAAAERVGLGPPAPEAAAGLPPRTAAERVLFYRRVLAAWQFLVTMGHEAALADLQVLRELERTRVAGGEEGTVALGGAR